MRRDNIYFLEAKLDFDRLCKLLTFFSVATTCVVYCMYIGQDTGCGVVEIRK